ncbi:Na+/H+ antiporter NhaC family protein [Brevibacterium sp. UCMA 11752]|uniref:Na+/H+ antiporter NhaC family protein n=1 Tax=Brevibacterium sp. UCMA 11752 TaxID=2745946 RepID=UPI001F3BA160|nr:Na+/H+ antiporter NhaC family protein [Brevibacterium sp. UCMA 11752]MCF2586928.1 permease [Brevibacterium sp. UCMA 11752]
MADSNEASNEATSLRSDKNESSNAYEISLSPRRSRLIWSLAGLGIVLAIVAAFVSDGPTLWGLLPIVLYAVLAILGMDIVVATVVSVVAGLIIGKMGVLEIGTLLGDSLADQITIIGLIIMLGAGVGEVLKVTGVAQSIVSSVMHVFGRSGRNAVVFGVMISCLILVASLGTLAGAIAIAAPILLPITARLGFTKSATASMLFIGGCAGLAIAPFAGSNVAIMEAAEVNYGQYILYGAGPIALLSLALGIPIVSLMQRWTAKKGDFYSAEEVGGAETVSSSSRLPTAVFLVLLAISVVFAAVTSAGTTFPLLALPVLGIATAVANRMRPQDIVSTIYRGCSQVISIFLLFWLLAALFIVIDLLAPFDVVMDLFGSQLQSASPFVFTVIIALLGWVGVPGATAAQVVLLDKVFGDLGATLGVTAGSWVVVLLFASKADTYGPFPNGNMIGVMGLARSTNLRNMLITGWMLLVPACVLYFIILFVETR